MVSGPAQLGASTRLLARNALKLRGIFETVDELSCPGAYNFHMHTAHSDGQLAPENLVEQAIDLRLEEFAITDHHTVSGYYKAKRHLEDWQWRHPARIGERRSGLPRLWVGVEITASLADTEVHILGYAFKPSHESIQPYLMGGSPRSQARLAASVIAAIQAAGGLAVLAHPCRYRRSPQELIAKAVELGIDGIETYYAYGNPKQWQPCPKNTPAMQHLASEFGVLSTCGTDTHGKTITRRI